MVHERASPSLGTRGEDRTRVPRREHQTRAKRGENRTQGKRRERSAHYSPPPPCPLPYGEGGAWTHETTLAARRCVLDGLHRDLDWWKKGSCQGREIPAKADLDGTLCRLRSVSSRAVLTNMLLLRSVGGQLSATIMLDSSDERGPMRHWPARPVAALQQLAELQLRIDNHELPPLNDFTAILNPHDSPYQVNGNNWCGLVPIISNSRVKGEHRDLLMPDFSFAPLSYLTNSLTVNMSASLAVPQGWPADREKIYAAGRQTRWREKSSTLFWRGGETHAQRRIYADAFSSGNVRLHDGVREDVFLCGSHCSLEKGVRPEEWCSRQQLLSLPGVHYATGASGVPSLHAPCRALYNAWHCEVPSRVEWQAVETGNGSDLVVAAVVSNWGSTTSSAPYTVAGHSFAVGFKYTMLCSSTVVRGGELCCGLTIELHAP